MLVLNNKYSIIYSKKQELVSIMSEEEAESGLDYENKKP